MSGYRAVGLDSDFARQVREGRIDAFGGPVEVYVSDSPRKPCRHCLDHIPAEQALLLSHRPAPVPGPYSEVGPIFVCSEACAPFAAENRLPPVLEGRRVVVRGYTAEERINYEASEIVEGEDAEPVIRRFLEDPKNAYLQVRTALFGCFLCKVERA